MDLVYMIHKNENANSRAQHAYQNFKNLNQYNSPRLHIEGRANHEGNQLEEKHPLEYQELQCQFYTTPNKS